MSDKTDQNYIIDPEHFSKIMADLGERSSRIWAKFLDRTTEDDGFQVADPKVISKAFSDLATQMISDPGKFAEAQQQLWGEYMKLWDATARRMIGETVEPVVAPDKDDKRFKDDTWTEETYFDYVKQSYLLTSRWIFDTVKSVDGLDEQTERKIDFYTRQFVDALSPTNFVATNPKVLRETLKTKGENLAKGFENLLNDLEKGRGSLKISMTDETAFTFGENIASTPGKVVFQNELMQLIQYTPTTETVHKVPMLIVPPWINKYYVMDLQPKNSLIKWAVDQGNTVFVISWVNPGLDLKDKRFDDYMLEGPVAAMDAIKKATGEDYVNVAGYCIGGTLTACTLAYLAAKGIDRVASATYFTTMTDFEDPGELKVFIDEEQIAMIEEHMEKKGYLDGAQMAQVFSMLRDNDLIWSFVVNNYLMGREPVPFDLLYWNSDSTRMPAMMHSVYLRQFYLNNQLREPGGVTLADTPLDLSKIKVPSYMISAKEDHIAPWKSTYAGTQLFGGANRFVLGASGHIAGVINPPASNKYCYWTNTKLPKNPDAWFEGATQHEGSWWTDWDKWLKKQSGKDVKARKPGSGKLKVLEDAPGSYVQMRLSDD